MKQPSAPASVLGTASAFSGEITEALVKSHRQLVGHFPFPFKSKGTRQGLGGGIGGQVGGGRRQKKEVKGPTGEAAELYHVTQPLAESQSRG